jgi:RNA polymerase sigma-70 factor (ECF subfamily)
MVERPTGAGRWLPAAHAGSSEALGQALEACRGYLLLIAQRHLDADLQAKGGASDLVQETFLEAQRDFGQFRGTSEGELLAWLRRLLLNNLGHFTRRYGGTGKRAVGREVAPASDDSSAAPGPALPAETPSPSGQAMAREQAEALRRALTRLPDDYRRVITLRYDDGQSFEEIGRLMGRSPDAARKLWARAMERLRQEWEGAP